MDAFKQRTKLKQQYVSLIMVSMVLLGSQIGFVYYDDWAVLFIALVMAVTALAAVVVQSKHLKKISESWSKAASPLGTAKLLNGNPSKHIKIIICVVSGILVYSVLIDFWQAMGWLWALVVLLIDGMVIYKLTKIQWRMNSLSAFFYEDHLCFVDSLTRNQYLVQKKMQEMKKRKEKYVFEVVKTIPYETIKKYQWVLNERGFWYLEINTGEDFLAMEVTPEMKTQLSLVGQFH